MKPRRPLNKPAARPQTFDARNKIIQKTRAKIVDARDILNQNIRDSGIDARNVLLERKKERMPLPMPLPPHAPREPRSEGVHKGRFGQRIIMMNNRPGGGLVQTLWDPKDDLPHAHGGGYKSSVPGRSTYQSSRLNASAKPFVPRGYVDYDNMQQLEDGNYYNVVRLLFILIQSCYLVCLQRKWLARCIYRATAVLSSRLYPAPGWHMAMMATILKWMV